MKTAIELAREAGFEVSGEHLTWESVICTEEVERLIELARADEREAMVAEAAKQGLAMKNEDLFEDYVREIAVIRARGA
jgi:hypothetical protein